MLLDQSPLAEHVSALVVVQLRVTDSPTVIEVADAEKEFIFGDGLVTGGLVSDDPPPPPPPQETINIKDIKRLEIFFIMIAYSLMGWILS